MSIPVATESKTLRAFHQYVVSISDYFALCGGAGVDGEPGYVAPRIRIGRALPRESTIVPRQLNMYLGGLRKAADGGKAWPTRFDIIIEYYVPRNELSFEEGVIASWNEAKHLAGLIFLGQSPHATGRYLDPDGGPDDWVTDGITEIEITDPETTIDNAAVRRMLIVTCESRENATGVRL